MSEDQEMLRKTDHTGITVSVCGRPEDVAVFFNMLHGFPSCTCDCGPYPESDTKNDKVKSEGSTDKKVYPVWEDGLAAEFHTYAQIKNRLKDELAKRGYVDNPIFRETK